MVKPRTEIIKKHKDLHHFTNWDKPILTDSGGFQVFSLSKLSKVTKEGVYFRSLLMVIGVFYHLKNQWKFKQF